MKNHLCDEKLNICAKYRELHYLREGARLEKPIT